MAHLIETMAYAGQTPWHGLGVTVDGTISPEELLEQAGLAWDAVLVPNFIKWQGKDIELPRYASVRSTDGAILTPAVSKSWKPVQNKTALEFFNDFCAAGDMSMETAGAIRSGKWIWALAKIKESFSLFKGKDVVDGYLLFSNPHTAGRAIMIQFTPIRVVCNNTLMMSLESYSEEQGAGRFKHLHTDHFDPEQAKAALGIAKGQLSAFRETAEFLAKKRMKEAQFLEFAQRLFPANDQEIAENLEWKAVAGRRAQQLVRVLDKQPGAELGAGTWWQGVNAVTYLIDHRMTQNQDKRLTSAWLGFGRDKKQEAVKLAVKMAA